MLRLVEPHSPTPDHYPKSDIVRWEIAKIRRKPIAAKNVNGRPTFLANSTAFSNLRNAQLARCGSTIGFPLLVDGQ